MPVLGPEPATSEADYTPLATPAELRSYLGLDESQLGDERANLILVGVSAEIRKHTGQIFDQVEDDEVILDSIGSSVLLLPQLPVIDIASIEDLDDDTATFTVVTDYRWSVRGIIRRTGARWAEGLRRYKVTYTHGYENIPDDLTLICLRAAARAAGNPEGLTQESMGNYSASWGLAVAGLTDIDRRDLDFYRA